MKNMTFKKITSQRLFLPIFCLALVLLVNIVTTPNFFAIEVRNGVLYGYLIDIINRASELVILAVGMTLVVSSSAGTDISVGAIMAVSAAVCCNLLTGGERAATAYAIVRTRESFHASRFSNPIRYNRNIAWSSCRCCFFIAWVYMGQYTAAKRRIE